MSSRKLTPKEIKVFIEQNENRPDVETKYIEYLNCGDCPISDCSRNHNGIIQVHPHPCLFPVETKAGGVSAGEKKA